MPRPPHRAVSHSWLLLRRLLFCITVIYRRRYGPVLELYLNCGFYSGLRYEGQLTFCRKREPNLKFLYTIPTDGGRKIFDYLLNLSEDPTEVRFGII